MTRREQTVTWTNHDPDIHTVAFDAGPALPDSGVLDSQETFSFTFTQAGSYHYHCNVHPLIMLATLTVKGQEKDFLPLVFR